MGVILWTKIAVVFVVAISAQVAGAAELPVKARVIRPQPEPTYKWTGFYVGANAGYGFGSQDGTLVSFPQTGTIPTSVAIGQVPSTSETHTHGFFGGAQFGYNWRSGSYLFGMEADFQAANLRGSSLQSFSGATVNGIFFVPTTDAFEERLKAFGTVRARLGLLPMERLLVYTTGGFAYGWFASDYTDTTFPPAPNAPIVRLVQSSKWSVGWTAGGGVEWKLSPNLSAKAEYLYLDLGTTTEVFSQIYVYRFQHHEQIARVGLNWAFAR